MRTASLLALGLGLLPASALAAPPQIAWVASNQIRVIDMDRGEVVGRIPLQEFIHDMAFSADGARAFVGSSGGLRVADAEGLTFTGKWSERPTIAVDVDGVHGTVVALVNPPGKEALAARQKGIPEPRTEVMVFDATTGVRKGAWEVAGMPLDLEVDPIHDRIYVLEALGGTLKVFDGSGRDLETINLAPGRERYMFSHIELSVDGQRLVAPRTDETETVLVDLLPLAAVGTPDRLLFQPMGNARRIRDCSFDARGSLVLSSLKTLARTSNRGGKAEWEELGLAYSGVETVPSTGNLVLIAPTLDPEVGSGGVTLADSKGHVIRSVELLDVSPFSLAVRPVAPRP